MNNDKLKELLKEEAEYNKKRSEEIKENPLSEYSTTQLKAELRRRKRNKYKGGRKHGKIKGMPVLWEQKYKS